MLLTLSMLGAAMTGSISAADPNAPELQPASTYTDNPALAVKLDELFWEVAPVGSYFTVSGQPCDHSSGSTCDNCRLDLIMADRGYSWLNVTPSYTCYAFGQFVFGYIYGINSFFNYHGNDIGNMKRIGRLSEGCEQLEGEPDGEITEENLIALFEKAEAGDIIAGLNGDRGSRHIMVYLDRDADGIYVYHANWGSVCNVAYTYLTWERIMGFWKHVITLYRASDYLQNCLAANGGTTAVRKTYKETPLSAVVLVGSETGAPLYSIPVQDGANVASQLPGRCYAEVCGYYIDDNGDRWYALLQNGEKFWLAGRDTIFARYVDSYTLTGETAPEGEFESLRYFDLRGKIVSSNKITSVTGQIIDTATGEVVMDASVKPNASSIELRYTKVNYGLDFSRLKEGAYRYTLSMTTEAQLPGEMAYAGAVELISSTFAITGQAVVSDEPEQAVESAEPEETPVNPLSAAVADATRKNTAEEEQSTSLFTDVPAEAWYQPYVAKAYSLGVMKGKEENVFDPEGAISLAEAITMAARIYSAAVGDGETFAYTGGEWYAPYVAYAEKNGILTDSYYGKVTRSCERCEFANLLVKAVSAASLQAINTVEDGAIPDVPTDSKFAEAVYTFYRAGVTVGDGAKGYFHPSWGITRAEVAAIITRLLDESYRVSTTLTN